MKSSYLNKRLEGFNLTTEMKNEIDFIEEWITPYYFKIDETTTENLEIFIKLKSEITDELITRCLTYKNWRSKKVGSFFAAITNSQNHIDKIGNLLLESETYYTGNGYATTLTSFNNEASLAYLKKYLSIYLERTDLNYDQHSVILAIKSYDYRNDTDHHGDFLEMWDAYNSNKFNSDDFLNISHLNQRLEFIDKISNS